MEEIAGDAGSSSELALVSSKVLWLTKQCGHEMHTVRKSSNEHDHGIASASEGIRTFRSVNS